MNAAVSCATAALLIAAGLAAQASSRNHVMTSAETASGTLCASASYELAATLGDGVVAGAAASGSYALLGGFPATLDLNAAGRPWLMGVEPRFATMNGAAALALRGTELNLGPTPTITIDGLAANVVTRQNQEITTVLPFQPGPISQPGPGWQSITVSNSAGTTTLPRAIGILPMLETDPAPAPDTAFDIVFHGSPGDLIGWTLGTATMPPFHVPGTLYGLGLNPSTLAVLPALSITAPSGELRFAIPPLSYPRPLYVQALFVTSNPGYAPASFSNVLAL